MIAGWRPDTEDLRPVTKTRNPQPLDPKPINLARKEPPTFTMGLPLVGGAPGIWVPMGGSFKNSKGSLKGSVRVPIRVPIRVSIRASILSS